MSYQQDKLIAFENSILSNTTQEIDKLEQDLATYEKEELAKAKEAEYQMLFSFMQTQVQELKAKYKKIVTKETLSGKQELLLYRNALAQKIFDEAQEKMLAFTETFAYAEFLKEKLQVALQQFPCETATLLLRKEDLSLGSALQQAFPIITAVTVDPKNTLGGFSLKNEQQGLLLDQTFSSALEDKKPAFYAACDLSVQF